MSQGSHTIKLTKSGYQDWTGTANITAGETAFISVTLVPVTPPMEAVLASCQWPLEAIAGQAANVTITVNQGSLTGNYKLVFSGDFTGESTPFIVDAGAKQQQFTIGNLIFTTGGTKNVSATLIKV